MSRQCHPHCTEGVTEAKEIHRHCSVSYKYQRQESNTEPAVIEAAAENSVEHSAGLTICGSTELRTF